ncbi:hypothetical protein TEA_025255 [Camellia sinensis var. sinensis]|uniref:Uncharacterized protein n=1 Tax=Camellia sinensis var. sinensis TaxID=542762 RepID=A0A4S4EUA7_CAMSN|nr:hypothetical protein TEA_025255 [Camellia sinensis var. sinensis]
MESDPSLLYQDSDAWNKFHSRHSSGKVFKERRCFLREFPELLPSDKYSKAEEVIDAADFVSGKHCYHPFPCDFSISGFLKRLAWDPCIEVILQKQDICLLDIHAVGITTSQDANSNCSMFLCIETWWPTSIQRLW